MKMVLREFEKVFMVETEVDRFLLPGKKTKYDYVWKDRFYQVCVLDWKIYNGVTYAIVEKWGHIETVDSSKLMTPEEFESFKSTWYEPVDIERYSTC